MAMEDNIRLIVEQVLQELGKTAQPAAGGSCPATAAADNGNDGNGIEDLAKVDLQRYLQVPEPQNRGLYEEMKLTTPARIGVWRCGTRPLTDTWLRFRADHAVAQDSVLGEVPEEFPAKYNMVSVKSMCESKDEYLTRPDLGRKLDEESLNLIRSKCRKGAKLQIIVADGLSSNAVEANIPNLLPAMLQGLEDEKAMDQTDRIVKFISEHYTEPLSMPEVAERFHMSESHFSRIFQRCTGNSFTDFLIRVRITRACQLLMQTDENIATICFDVGFNNVANFNRRFLSVKGITPSAFRQQTRSRFG